MTVTFKGVIVVLVLLGCIYPILWGVALLLYEIYARKGRDVVAIWLESHFRNNRE